MNTRPQTPEINSKANKTRSSALVLSLQNLLILILLGAFSIQVAVAQEGANLHVVNCIACHAAMTGGEGSVLYTRDDRTVKSQDALTKQVNRCQSSLGLAWSNTQINNVQQYLNESFYKF